MGKIWMQRGIRSKYWVWLGYKIPCRVLRKLNTLSGGKIEECPVKDNIEINSEITQGSESLYSIDGE